MKERLAGFGLSSSFINSVSERTFQPTPEGAGKGLTGLDVLTRELVRSFYCL
jgi:hypothetical protein